MPPIVLSIVAIVQLAAKFAPDAKAIYDEARTLFGNLFKGGLITSARCPAICTSAQYASLIGKILVPEVVANVCFGGLKRNRLFICGTTSLYAVYVMTNGVKTY